MGLACRPYVRALALALAVLGCAQPIEKPSSPPRLTPPSLAPAPGRYLHKKVAATGDPLQTPEGLVTEEARVETRAYYAAQMSGIRCLGDCVAADAPYPRDLRSWKLTFGIPRRAASESLADYRTRALVAVYYNRNELGLGREMGCGTFVTAGGRTGTACYVTNYGHRFNDREAALRDAVLGAHARNTVCIVFNPELPDDHQVNFWNFAGADPADDGAVHVSAQLDTMGDRAVPQICTGCHAGTYDAARHLVRAGRFLPANVFELEFSALAPLAKQEEAFRTIIAMSLATPLTPSQIDVIEGTYGGRIHISGERARRFVPPAYRGTLGGRSAEDLYRLVLSPYCNGCHDALQGEPGTPDFSDPRALVAQPALLDDVCDAEGGGSDAQWQRARPAFAAACASCHAWHERRAAVDTAASLIRDAVVDGDMPREPHTLSDEQRDAILAYTSGHSTWGYGFTMPNAQPTQRRFWERPVVDGRGVRHPSAKSYLLGTWLAGLRPDCGPLGCDCPARGCNLPNPRSGLTGDALCGASERCDDTSGRCLPAVE